MADLLRDDTDFEMLKYTEASDILEAGLDPAILKNKKSVFNPETGTNDILLPMPSGGYTKVGEEGVDINRPSAILLDGMEYGPDTPEYQRYYPAPTPSPLAMTEAPAMGQLAATEAAPKVSPQTKIEDVQSYAQQLQEQQGAYTLEDLTAAGYSEGAIAAAGLDVAIAPPQTRTEELTPEEVDKVLAEGGSLFTSDPTLRQQGVQAVEAFAFDLAVEGLRDELEASGAGQRTIEEEIKARTPELLKQAEIASNILFGTKNPLEFGIADFTTGGIMDIQEGYRMFQQSRQGETESMTGRAIGMGMMLAGVAEATGVGLVAGKLMKKGLQKIQPSLVQMGADAEQRIAQEGNMLFSNPVGPGVDRLLAGLGKLVSKTKEQGVRAEGGLPIAPEKGSENLRLHLNRLEKMREAGTEYPGAPKNPRTVIKPPEGSGLPDVVVGNIEPEDWKQRIEASMSPEEIKKAASWYKIVFGEFQKQANGDPEEIAKLTDAWFAGQQNSSPQQTLNDVLYVYEQINRGVPKEKLKGKGLPSANKIVIDILTGSTIEGGAGQKIADFLDSGYGKNVRAIMGNKPEGGSPFVVDIHTARDTGLVDEIYINHLKRLGYDVPENLIVDVGGGGIKGPQYESRALFGQQLTEELNDQNWMGRNDWEPAEIQAIGWMQLSGMYGGSNTGGDVVDAFTRTTRRISMEVDPGAGSPWAAKFGEDFGNLPLEDRRAINDEVTAKAIELVNKQTGITLGNNVHGTGGWELWQNPSTVQQAIASKETAIEAGARLGYLLQQTEVWVNSPKAMTKNPKHFSIDIVETTGESLRDSDKLTALFDKIIAEEPNGLFRGYQPIMIDGKPGIRILITDDAVKASPLTKAKAIEYIQEFANTKLGDITDELNFDAEIDIMEADLTRLRNNWEEDQTGGGYKSYFSGQSGKDAASDSAERGVLDTDGAELEKLFQQRIDEAKRRSGAR